MKFLIVLLFFISIGSVFFGFSCASPTDYENKLQEAIKAESSSQAVSEAINRIAIENNSENRDKIEENIAQTQGSLDEETLNLAEAKNRRETHQTASFVIAGFCFLCMLICVGIDRMKAPSAL